MLGLALGVPMTVLKACALAVARAWGKAQTGSVSLADENAEARAEAKPLAPPVAAAEAEACARARATLSQQLRAASTRACAVAVAKALLPPPAEETELQSRRAGQEGESHAWLTAGESRLAHSAVRQPSGRAIRQQQLGRSRTPARAAARQRHPITVT